MSYDKILYNIEPKLSGKEILSLSLHEPTNQLRFWVVSEAVYYTGLIQIHQTCAMHSI